MSNEKNVVVCPVGLNGSGKGNVCSILARNHGFVSLSTSDVIRSLVRERGLDLTRENMGTVANAVRSKQGSDYTTVVLSKEMDLRLHSYVIDGCRQVEEITYLQNTFSGRVVVVKVYCDPVIRFQRMKARNRSGDPETYDAFLHADEIELGNVDAPNKMNYRECFELVQYQIDNNGSFEELEQNVAAFLGLIS